MIPLGSGCPLVLIPSDLELNLRRLCMGYLVI
jgi:hypothetical protein